MKLTGNTIFITGGGSGIGRGLAEALHARGNRVIIGGRRQAALDAVIRANPGIEALTVDIADPSSIAVATARLVADYPELNVLINNAGIQRDDRADGAVDDAVLTQTVATNLLGPIRLTGALIAHLKLQRHATVVHVSSMLALVPLARVSIYCASKAALHSYALTQRYALKDSGVEVIEILPTYVKSELNEHSKHDPRAMPLDAYITETMAQLEAGTTEIVVAGAMAQLAALRPDERQAVARLNDVMKP